MRPENTVTCHFKIVSQLEEPNVLGHPISLPPVLSLSSLPFQDGRGLKVSEYCHH